MPNASNPYMQKHCDWLKSYKIFEHLVSIINQSHVCNLISLDSCCLGLP